MDKQRLKELIVEHKERFLARGGLVTRDLQQQILRYLPQREIIVLTGVRRCGKSSLMRLICADLMENRGIPANHILYLNFEDERFLPFTVQDFDLLYETFIEIEKPQGCLFLFLDEIQNLTGWEKWLNRLYEFEDVKIFVSGSNATLLSSDVSTALTGRNRQIVVWPFSFREFLRLRGFLVDGRSFFRRGDRLEIKRLFKEYVEVGGFPEALKTGDPSILIAYYRDIVYRDVIARNAIKNIREIKELALFLAANPATVQSYQSLKGLIGVRSLNTVKNYLAALNEVFLFFFTDLFDYSVKRQIYNPSKVYAVDAAMINAISFRFSRNIGHLYENIVFVELKRQAKEIYYGKTRKGQEVDFLIKTGFAPTEAIQVAWSLEDAGIRRRELQALVQIQQDLQQGRDQPESPLDLTVITDDEEERVEIDGAAIRIVPLWKWLLAGIAAESGTRKGRFVKKANA